MMVKKIPEQNRTLKRHSIKKKSIKSQNYVTPEISYINKIPEYSNINNRVETVSSPKNRLSNIREEENLSELEKSNIEEFYEQNQDYRTELNYDNFDDDSKEEYMGLFDIIMKELSDFPKNIKEKIKLNKETLFEDSLEKIKKRKRKRSKISMEEHERKLNVCTYHCNSTDTEFDLNKSN